jgi:putative ABC transport system ATP-binding protein
MIKLHKVNKFFYHNKEKITVLKEFDLMINKGECVVFKGESGSGKSTLLSLIGGMDKPTSGDIIIDNYKIAKLPDLHVSHFRAMKIGFIFQSYNLIEDLTVFQNVSTPLVPLLIDNSRLVELTATAMKIANIYHKQHQKVISLSGGEKQRCAIARAIVNNPKILLCDEPTANLDKNNSLKFIEFLREYKNKDNTIIVATHDAIFENLDFVDRVIEVGIK